MKHICILILSKKKKTITKQVFEATSPVSRTIHYAEKTNQLQSSISNLIYAEIVTNSIFAIPKARPQDSLTKL